jgi:hypothetical protein
VSIRGSAVLIEAPRADADPSRRLYSEKAYVLSRSFVKTALERPPGGLDDEIRDIYINEGRLQRVIDHAKPLMEQGEAARDKAGGEVPEEEVWNADAMGSLTMGAILSLKVSHRVIRRSGEESKLRNRSALSADWRSSGQRETMPKCKSLDVLGTVSIINAQCPRSTVRVPTVFARQTSLVHDAQIMT